MRNVRWWQGAKLVLGTLFALAAALPAVAEAVTQDLTNQFAITRSGLVLNRATNTFDSTVTLRNTSSAPVLAPISVVVGGLPGGVTLSNMAGLTADLKPYVSPMAADSLLQSGSSLTVVLKYANPQRVAFSSTLQILHVVDVPPDAPSLIGVAATGGTNAFLVGRVDGAVRRVIGLQVSSSPTCVAGTLVNPAAVGGPVEATTDDSGYFGVSVAGVNPGAFVTLRLTSPTASPASLCQVSSRDNDSWPKAFLLEGSSTSARDYIDSPGKARWYKFAVTPGQRIEVALTGLPADYDLAIFKDIGQAFASQFTPGTAARSADLLKLTAEYAPSTFSPSTFSPSTFSPDAYSPSTFSPSTFSPSTFSPSTFSPSTFSPSTFSPSTFSPSTFSPSTFSPSTFSPSTFSPSIYTATEIAQAFSTAQTRSIVAAAATPGTGNEFLVVNTFNSTGSFYVRVVGHNGAFDTSSAFTLSVTKGVTTCAGVTDTTLTPRAAVAASGLRTVLLTDSSKLPVDASLPVPGGGTLRAKLAALAARADVKGVVVDVAGDARVGALKQQAANNPACPFAKNLVAEEIKGIVDSYRANPLQYVVIVGNDETIPFFRSPDQSLLGEESSYVPPVQSNSPSEASLRRDFVLSQDGYGAKTRISLPTNEFPVPGLAVGRLVETATEIAGVIDAYVATDGMVIPRSSLVTGYDFLEDAAHAIKSELDLGIGAGGDSLITPNTLSPQASDVRVWTATDLAAKLLGARHDVIFLAGHFSANSALAADFTTSLLTTDLAASTVDLTNAIAFSAGCHSGYNLVDGDSIPGVTLPLDWAQAFARKKVTLIAGTGYQYGDTDFLEYSERLYNNFARQLRAGTAGTPIAVGEALVKAKLAYLATTPDIRGIHEKALLEATLFGLPMLSVNMPSGRDAVPSTGGAITPTAVATGPAASLGLKTYDLGFVPALTPHTISLRNVRDNSSVIATWLSGPDGVVTKPGEPALPLMALNVTPNDASLVLRGIGFRGATYVDSAPLLPFSGAPTTELRGVHVPFASPVFYPGRLSIPNYFGALAESGGTQLLVTPAQHRIANLGDGTSTQRKFTGLDLRLFYSGNLSQAALSDAPSIVGVVARQDPGGGLVFTAQVIGDPKAAIHQVWITYTGDGAAAWTSLDLAQCVAPVPAACGASEDSRLWTGRLAGAPPNVKYFVQAVNGVGLVASDDNRGWYYAFGAATPETPAATTPALVSPPTRAAVGDTVDITTRLTFGGVPIAGRVVTVAIGGVAQIGVTASDGSVTVHVPAAAVPGTYQMTVSFAGDDVFQPSSTTSSFVIDRAAASLAAAPGAGATLTGVLAGQSVVLQQENVTFTVEGPNGSSTTIWGITDSLGRATFPPSGLPAGDYTVRRIDFAGNPTYADAHLVVAQAFTVAKAAQGITFAPLPAKTTSDPDFALFATASSGLPVAYAASGACTVAGNTVHITGAGSCTITASQVGDSNYLPATPVSQGFAITPPVNAPTVVSLARAVPSPTMADSVDYTLSFSQPVTGVASSNFAVVASGISGGSVAAISGGGSTWTVAVNTGRGSGSLHLDVVNGTGITNAGGTPLAGTPVIGETYQIDKGGTVVGVGEGRPVASFGSSGYALFSEVQEVTPPAVAVLADGRILAAGGTQCIFTPVFGGCSLQLARYSATGAPDASFGTNGRVVTGVTNINFELSALIVNADGTFFVSGSRDNGTAQVPFVAKFTSAGLPIATFGANGVASLNSLPLGFALVGSTIDGSGRVVIASTTPDIGPERNDIFVTRLTSTGAIDTTFGNGGVAQFAISAVDERDDRATAVAVQPDGKIVVGGRTQVTAGLGFDFVLLRIDAGGVRDPSFGNGGIATTRFTGSTGSNLGRKLVLQPDGRIVLVGGIGAGAVVTQCGIARFNADGTLDDTFGTGGQLLEPVTLGCFDVSQQADGKLVVAANDRIADVNYASFLRLLSTGAPDASFGTDGFVDISGFGSPARVAFTSSGNLVTSLVIQDPADGVLKSHVVELFGTLGGGGPGNQPPVANAGPDQTVAGGATVQMTSAGSSDPEGGPLAYAWSFTSRPSGSAAAFNNSAFANPTFIADRKGTYVAQLIVTDGGAPPLASAPDTVEITATNRAPSAVADSYSVAQGGTLVVAAATGVLANDSDADGDPLTAARVADVTHGSLTLNPDGGFTYTPSAGYSGPDSFTYRANDGTDNSNTVTVSLTVTVVAVNHPPVANAGSNQSVSTGQLVHLNGACTDSDGDSTTPAWSFASRPAGSNAALSSATILSPTFTADLAGPYQVQLICNDTHVDSAPSTVTITATSATLTLTLPGTLVGVGGTLDGTITLSAPAPAGGVQVALVSSNPAFVTVAQSPVTILAGATTGAFTVTGVAVGSVTITGTAVGYVGGTVDVGVTANVITVGFVAIAPGQTQAFSVTLAQPAPAGGVTITLASGDSGIVTVPPSVLIPAGAIVPVVNPIATGVAPGNASITGIANGYVTGSAWASIAAPVQWTAASGGNDRWYQFFYSPAGFTWQQAWAAASGNTFLGMPGYLATVTSQGENNFLYALAKYPPGATGILFDPANPNVNIGSTSIAGADASTWLGGADAATEGTWRWVNGPETGNLFWTGGSAGSTPPGGFAWWDNPSTPGGAGGTEPNASTAAEDFLQFRYSGGRWNDSSSSALLTLPGVNPNGTRVRGPAAFLVEYSPATPPVTFTVTNNDDSGVGSLRDAIGQANLAPGPNTIAFAPSVTGTILLTSGQIAINGPLTIVGPGANNLTLDGNANGRIFSIFATDPACPALDGPDYPVSISGLRLTNARRTTSNAAGAIFSEHSLALDSVIVDNSTAGNGGGVNVQIQYPGQSVTISNSQFLNNIAQPLSPTPGNSNGGALSVVERCTGTLTTPVVVNIAGSTFSGNRSQPVGVEGHGGAILLSAYADVTITDTRIADNHVVLPAQPVGNNNGGGLWSRVKSLRIERSEIAENSADFGGGLRLNNDVPELQAPVSATPVRIVDSTISGNVAGGGSNQSAGAIHVYGNVALEVDNSTISDNSAVGFVGGILLSTGATDPASASNATAPTLTLASSILANNAGPGGDVGSVTATIPALVIAAGNSLVETVCAGCNISLSGSGNLTAVDPALGPLAFNGGATRTQALLAGSPAIDTGSNPLALATDQRGAGFARVVGAAADMGAYEGVTGPAIGLSLTSPLVGITRTINGTVTLSQPAPAGGIAVSLVSGNTALVTVAPSSVTIAAGTTTASFTVTGVALGGPVTLTGSGAGFADGITSVTVTNALVSLGTLPVIGLGQSVSLPVSLTAPAPAGGLTVSFVSSDPAVATVAASVFVAAGQTIPAANPQVIGVNIGSAQISASAAGFAPDARTAEVQVSVTLTPTTLSLPQATSQDITVNISAPAPAGGLTIALATANPAIATVASPVVVLQGQVSATAAVTGVAVGSTTLQATGNGVTSATATINVTAPPALNLNLGNQTIGKDLQVQPGLSLSTAAPAGGLVVTLTSLDASKVVLSASATTVGGASITVTVPAGGSTSNAFFVQALSDTGTVTVTASAAGYASDTATITLAPSGFYNSSPGGNFTTTTFSANTLFRVQSARLTAAGVLQATQELRGGITVNVPVTVTDVSGTNVGSITSSPMVFSGGDGFKDTAFHPISAGTAQITIGVPAGFIAPTNVPQIVTATVTAPAITIPAQTIGKDLQVQPSVSLGAPAPAGGLVVTLTSSDASKVLLSTSATTAGSPSITVTIAAGNSSSSAFFIQALSDTGTASVTGSAPGFATTVNPITLAPSGFYNSSPGGNFTTTTFSANTLFRVQSARLTAAGVLQATQNLRGGITVNVPVTVADVSGTNVGSITSSPVVFSGGDGFKDTTFHPISAGTAQITIGVPAGFIAPTNVPQIVTATVTAPAITIPAQTIGKDLQVQPSVSLGAPAPAGGLVVTLTSSDASKVLLSTSATTAGSPSITVTIAAGNSSSSAFFIQALSDTGTASVTGSAPGFATTVNPITLAPSGFYNSSPGGNFTTTTFSANTLFRVQSARLTAAGVLQATQELRGGITVNVPVTVTDVSGTNVGSITSSPMVFSGGDGFKDTAFHPISAGTAHITIGVPAGFIAPTNVPQIVTATVNAPPINLGNVIVGRDLQASASITLGAAPPSPVTVTVTIASGTIALVSSSGTVAGGTTLTFNNVTTTNVGTIFVQGIALGGTQITVQAPGYSDDTSTVTVTPSGFYNSSPGGNFTTTTLSTNTLFRVQSARLTAAGVLQATQDVRGGITVNVPVTVTDVSGTNVGSITSSPMVFSGGDGFKDTTFHPISAGTAQITIGVPAGFIAPTNVPQVVTATVTAPAITIANQTIGKDLQVNPSVSLGAPAPVGGLVVTLTSSDTSKVLLSTNDAVAGGASITVTVPAGSSSVGGFAIQALSDTGTANVIGSAAGFATSANTVTLAPSGFYNSSPGGNFTTTTLSANTLFRVQSARLTATGVLQATQNLRGGITVNVPVTVADVSGTNVGSITSSPMVFSGGDGFKDTAFHPISAGTAQITIGVPAGFIAPSNVPQIVTATVTAPAINLTNQTIGKDLQVASSVSLAVAAPAGGLVVTLTSLDPSRVVLSTNPAAAGSASITVTVPAGSSSVGGFAIQALSDTGSATIMATANAFGSDTATITLTPSGFANSIPGGNFSTTTVSANTLFRVQPARLDPVFLNVVTFQDLRGGIGAVLVPVTSGTPSVGTITVSPLSFSGGDSFKDTAFDPLAVGTTVLTVGVPSGFSSPSNDRVITATVN